MNFENGMYLVLLFFFEGCGGRGGGGGGGGGGAGGCEHKSQRIFCTRHIGTTSSTEPYSKLKAL